MEISVIIQGKGRTKLHTERSRNSACEIRQWNLVPCDLHILVSRSIRDELENVTHRFIRILPPQTTQTPVILYSTQC